MNDDIFNLDDFVSDAPVAKKQAAPAEYDNSEFTMDPVAVVKEVAVAGTDGIDGRDGLDGAKGADGIGLDGRDGLDGYSGSDGVSVVDTFVQGDDLFMRLSDGKLINAGNVRGPQGFQGPQGSGGGSSYRGGGLKKSMFVQDDQPDTSDPFMWLQTNVNTKGDFSLWFNNC